MRKLILKDIQKIYENRMKEDIFEHHLFYDEDGEIELWDMNKVKFVIKRGGFVSSMDNETFFTTMIELVGYTGSSYKQSSLDKILTRLKSINYVPQHDSWRLEQHI